MKKLAAFSFLLGTLLCCFTACKDPVTNSCATDFDQLSLLSNIGNNIIAPSYQQLATEADELKTAVMDFNSNPTTATLTTARTKFQTAWMTWQTAAIFEFGPAETEELRNYMSNFPVFVNRLNTAITSGSYDLTSETYSFTRGFPAVDYLLYGVAADDNAIINMYTSNGDAANRKQFLQDVVDLIVQKSNAVNDAWKATGANYLNTFTTTEGTANGKPLSDLVNQLNHNYELIKNDKLGTPISAKTGYVPLLPANVEAYYSRQSLELAIEAIQAIKDVFTGTVNGTNGLGLDDYLEATGVTKGADPLQTVIINQYDLILTELNKLKPSTLHDAVTNNTEGVKTAYAVAQNQVVNTKTDMPAALCISITYIDKVDDGD